MARTTRTAKWRAKASKGKEESSNHSISNKGIKKLIKKKKSRKIYETFKSKVAQSTSRQELVSVPTHALVTTSIPLYNDQKKRDDTNGKKHISGFIFMCNGKTKSECYEYRVFGLPKGKIEVVKNISSDTKLFLFDTDLRLLYGIYQANSDGALDLEPTAFNGQYQAQLKFKIFKDCLPLQENDFKPAIEDNYVSPRKFRQELSSTQVKSLISLFRPFAKKRPSAKKSRVRRNVESKPSIRSTQTNKVFKSHPPPENLSSGVHYLPILETGPQHDVHHGQYNPFGPGPELHVHSQVQPRFVRVESPPRHVEAYHPEHAYESYFHEKLLRYPPDSYESFRPTIETNVNGDHRYGHQYHASQSLSSRDVSHVHYTPDFYSQRLSPTTTHTAPLTQARLSPYRPRDRVPSPYRVETRLPSPYRVETRLPSQYPVETRLPSPYRVVTRLSSPYRVETRLPSPYRVENRLPSPHRVVNRLPSPQPAPHRVANRLPSPHRVENRLRSPYRLENRMPSPYRSQNRLLFPYRSQNRLPSPYRSQNRLPSPHRSYYSAASEDRGRVYAGSPQGRPASGNLRYGESNLPIPSYYYSSAATRPSYR